MACLLYKMTSDSGFAPNPYGDYLTLATCTPNHMKANLKKGDWIIGIESEELAALRKKAGCLPDIDCLLIFAAQVEEILDLNSYFHDPRFDYKKPKPSSPYYSERRGDNIYYKDNGYWKWIRGHDHDKDCAEFFPVGSLDLLWNNPAARTIYGEILQDIRGNRVFVSQNFFYFGDMGVEFPPSSLHCESDILNCVPNRGIKYCDDPVCECFINWLKENFKPGKLGDPICCCISGNISVAAISSGIATDKGKNS